MLFKFNEKIGNFFNWEDWPFTCEKKENITKPLITMTRWKKAYLIFFQNISQSGVFCKKISLTVLEPVKILSQKHCRNELKALYQITQKWTLLWSEKAKFYHLLFISFQVVLADKNALGVASLLCNRKRQVYSKKTSSYTMSALITGSFIYDDRK